MRKLLFVFVLLVMASVLVTGGMDTVKAQETDSDEFTLEEITVTANRVESLASKTPVAVTAITGDTITQEGLSDTTMLENLVPNLSIVRANGLQVTIRGVTSTDGTEKGDPSAAVMLDNIYFGRPQFHEINMYDVARVEVLRGPQGTLYGRNTTAGVVNVITNNPKEIFESAFNLTVGNYGIILGDGMVNVPVNDSLALRAAFSYNRRDNFIETPNATQDEPFKNDLSFRLKTLYNINDNASLLVKFDYTDMKGSTWGNSETVDFSRLYDTSDPYNPVYLGNLNNDEILTDLTTSTQPVDQEMELVGGSAELNWDFGPVALTYLGSYHDISRVSNMSSNTDEPATFMDFTGDYWQTMQEMRLATTGDGPFQGQAGVYYFQEESGIYFYLYDFFGPDTKFGFPQDPTINKSYAVYGQSTYSLTPDLRLTTGIRYSNDYKSRVGATHMVFAPGVEMRLINDAEKTFDKTTWRVGLDYDLNDDTLLYGSVATGYKAGGFNDGCEPSDPDCNQPRDYLYYDPETILAYEIGTKTKFSDKVVLNATAFYYDYDNLQLSAVVEIPGGGANQVTVNAAKAENKGIEIESVFMPTPRNRINVNLAWLDATYADYWPLGEGNPPDYTGRSLDRSPEYTATLGYRYRHPLSNGGSLEGNLQFHYSDSYVFSNYSLPVQFEYPNFHKTDLSVTYTSPDGTWYVQAFGKNLEDEITFHAIGTGFTGMGPYNITPQDPRTYGVRAGVKF